MGKILFKLSNGLISVLWTLFHRKQWLRGCIQASKCVHTDTNDAECSACPNSAVVLENTNNSTNFGRS